MLKKENKVKKFLKKEIINIKGKINKVLKKNIIINIIHILTLLLNILILFFLFLGSLINEDAFISYFIIIFLSILNRIFFLFNNEIKKVTLYSDSVLLLSLLISLLITDPVFITDPWSSDLDFKTWLTYRKKTFFLCYLFPIGYSIYTKLLKK
jgi:hypothetical protein